MTRNMTPDYARTGAVFAARIMRRRPQVRDLQHGGLVGV